MVIEPTQQSYFSTIACVTAGLAVALGAFGAHGLPAYLGRDAMPATPVLILPVSLQVPLNSASSQPIDEMPQRIAKKIENFEKAVKYQMYHSLAILIVAVSSLINFSRLASIACSFHVAGMILFCGGLYGTVFSELPFHFVVPFGGLAFLIGWTLLAVSYINRR